MSDDFTGTSINSNKWWVPDKFASIENNKFKYQLGVNDRNRGMDMWSKSRLKDDFQMEADLNSFQLNPESGYGATYLLANNDWNAVILIKMQINSNGSPKRQLVCDVHASESNNPEWIRIGSVNMDGITSSTNVKLKVTRVGNTAACLYNIGGGDVLLGSKIIPLWADLVFAPMISTWHGGAEGTVLTSLWDNFTASGTLAEPVGIWYMDEGSGQTVADSSGKGNNGTATGTRIVYGKRWNGRSFNNPGDKITVNNSASLHSDRSITIMSWINTSVLDKTWQTILWKGNEPDCPSSNCGNREYALFLHQDGHLALASTPTDKIDTNAQYCQTPASTISPNKWFHVAGVVSSDSNTMKIYVNGVEKANCPYSFANIRSSTGPLLIGWRNDWDTFNGKIDDVRIYNYVRTPFQIIQEDMLGWAQTTQTVTDNFNTASLDLTKWNVGKTNPAITINQTNGGVYMTIPGSVDTGGAILEMKQRISSDFIMDIDVGSFQMDTVNGQMGTADINVWQPNKTFSMRWVRDNPDASASYIDYYKVDNGQVDDGPGFTIRSDSRPRMRLMRKGRIFYGAVNNGYGWQPVFMVDGFRGDNDTVSFTLNKGNGGTSTQDVKVYFDNLWGIYNNNCVRGLKGNLDCSGEGMVDTADFEIFRSNFGKSN